MRLLGVTRVVPPAGNLHESQPRTWTFIGFEIDDADAQPLADALSEALDDDPIPWYCNFSTDDHMWVVFRGRQFCYRRGDLEGRAAAEEYARSHGVPEPQLDWGD